ncbi:Hint domain-containing protein, partial [Leptospira alexanderi]|uniref:Hint domain-containing protein n=1 Tax=Leptospira alexanderi TaxID=100053 RepID=UPI002014F8FC
LGDMFGGSLGLFNSSGEGYLNSQGEFVPRTCFTAGTLVHTSQGTKKIEEVKVGDEVLSWDEESGEQEYHRVVKTFQREVNVVYTLHYSNGTQVETTDEHPFYIENKGWVPAKDLRSGDRSVLSNEKTLEIESITISERTTTVYNFEVEDAHSYYVGKDGILVHNDCVVTGPSMSLAAFNALLKYMPGASEAEIEAARKLIEIGNRPVDGTMDAVFDVAAYIDAACKNGCPPDIAMAPVKLGVSGLKVASELIRSGRFKEALSLFGSGVKNWVKGSGDVGIAYKNALDGGKHSGFLKNMLETPTPELQKGIASMNSNIIEHQNLMNDPAKYMQQYGKGDWNSLDPRQQQHLLNVKWPGDIQRAREQIDILTGIIKAR